jgi:hypothetical protein
MKGDIFSNIHILMKSLINYLDKYRRLKLDLQTINNFATKKMQREF